MSRCKFGFIFLTVQFLVTFCNGVNGANILACLTAASRSHHIMETRILEELANRGHNVTVLSTLPVSQKAMPSTYHHIYIPMEDTDEWSKLRKGYLNNQTKDESSQFQKAPKVIQLIKHRSSKFLKHSFVQDLMKSDQKFDLFFLDYNLNDMMLGLAGHFRVPSVIMSLMPPLKPLRDIIGNPAAVASAPVFSEPNMISKLHGFRERFSQYMGYVMEFFMTSALNYLVLEQSYEEHFPASENFPTLDEVRKNVSLIMINTHFSEGAIRPALPNLIEIGGLQIKEKPDPLPKNLQDILDATDENGVIVFTFGGNIESADMNKEKLQMFFNVFAKLKQKIIWKWESDEIPAGKPENVHMVKWLPQADLLAQPQVRFFISHCGIGGIFEAKYHGVPILGLPIYADQPKNAKSIATQGWAIALNFDHINETILTDSVQELLTNQTYKDTAQRLSQLFRDRPMTPLQTAVYWIEYVIRYDGAWHMQSPAAHMNFVQKNSLDVIFCLAAALCISIWVIVKVFKLIIRYRPLLVIFLSILAYYIISYMRTGDTRNFEAAQK